MGRAAPRSLGPSRKGRKMRRASLFFCLMTASGIAAIGQTFFGSVVGTLTDASGASVPGAPVVLTNTGTSERRAAETDSSGNYQFVNLVPGRYKIDIEKAGFKHVTRDEIASGGQTTVRCD